MQLLDRGEYLCKYIYIKTGVNIYINIFTYITCLKFYFLNLDVKFKQMIIMNQGLETGNSLKEYLAKSLKTFASKCMFYSSESEEKG